jgi:polyisoprenoid-binding protein YceI
MSKRAIAVVVAVVLLALGAGGLWWFLRDDAPAEVSLDAAVDSLEGGEGSADPTGGTGIEGTWTVDAESGEFDFESATGTFVGFRVEEELSTVGSTTAVGRTGDVVGSITIEGTTLTEAEVEVDLTTITTDESRRDTKVQAALETDAFPTATFVLTEPVDLGSAAASGGPVSVTAQGELTVHGVAQPVEVPIEAQVVDGTVVVVASIDVALSDFGVTAPSAPIVVSVSDAATVEMQLLLTRG